MIQQLLVLRIWKQGKNQLADNIPVMVPNLKKGRSGRKPIPLDLEQLCNIPLQQRMTIEYVSSRLGISKSRIQRYLKKGLIRRHSSSIKPYLTNANKKTRLKWYIDMIDQGLLDDPKFKDLFDFVFIDEKWFYLHKNQRGTTCYPRKMSHIELAKIRTTSLGSCSCVYVLGQDLEMENVCLMAK